MRSFSYFETAVTSGHICRRLAGLAYFCAYGGQTSPRAGHRAGPPRVRPRQAGTVAEGANEKVRLASRKGPRSTRGERSELQSWDDTILGMLHILTIVLLAANRRGCWSLSVLSAETQEGHRAAQPCNFVPVFGSSAVHTGLRQYSLTYRLRRTLLSRAKSAS